MTAKARFTPFPLPRTGHPDEVQLVRPRGSDYVCTGCGQPVPDGMLLYPDVDEAGMVTGLAARGAPAAPAAHACGSATGE